MAERDAGLKVAHGLKNVCITEWHTDPARAVKAAQALEEFAGQFDLDEARALADWSAGIAALAQGRMNEAVPRLESAAQAFRTLSKEMLAAETDVSLLAALAMLGRYEDAIRCAERARATFVAANDVRAAGKIEHNLGNLHARRDDFNAAAGYYRSARSRFTLIGDLELQLAAQKGLADTLSWQNDFAGASSLYEAALPLAEPWPILAAQIEGDLGALELTLGHYERALNFLRGALRRTMATGAPHRVAFARQRLADAYVDLRLLEDAVPLLESVAIEFRELELRADEAWALAQWGRALALSGRDDEAKDKLALAASEYSREQNAVGAAWVDLVRAEIALRAEDSASAARHAQRALPVLGDAGLRAGQAKARWIVAEARCIDGSASVDELKSLVRDVAQLGLGELERSALMTLGRLSLRRGDRMLARESFATAANKVEDSRAALPGDDWRAPFFSARLAPFEALTQLLLDDGNTEEALRQHERAKARSFLDSMGQRDTGAINHDAEALRRRLDWHYRHQSRPDQDPASSATLRELEREWQELRRQTAMSPVTELDLNLSQLMRLLGPTQALVEYVDLDGDLSAFVITDEVVRHVGLHVRRSEVAELLADLRFQTDTLRHDPALLTRHMPHLTSRCNAHLKGLHDRLLRPLANIINERDLIIVPQGILHHVPFHALHNGQDYLISLSRVSVAPSAAIFHRSAALPALRAKRSLVVGVESADVPGISREVNRMAACLPGSQVLTGDRASRQGVEHHARAKDILHFACHGQFRSDNPHFSALRLTDSQLNARDVASLTLDPGLVVLSACETGMHLDSPGDELIGLARSFMTAGAASVLATLWTINDSATVEFMANFYGHLLAGGTPSESVRAAQRGAIRQGAHPYFWAPFVLIGRP